MGRSNRRQFLAVGAGCVAGTSWLAGRGLLAALREKPADSQSLFAISLAQWSLNRRLFGREGQKLDNLDFAATARTLGIDAIEYVNQFFMDKATDEKYLGEMRRRAEGEGVRSLLIMCDREGALGDPDPTKRTQAVTNHHKWVDAAVFLGCHSIRVNAQSQGDYEEQIRLAADGLRRLCEYADGRGINVIVENHGGLSSNGGWLSKVIQAVAHPRAGTLPDFGNFRISKEEMYDRYQGVAELMPYAKAVSAKAHDFDEQGNEKHTDFFRMMKIVLEKATPAWDATGRYVGIEYEGKELDQMAGIAKTRALLERVRSELAANA